MRDLNDGAQAVFETIYNDAGWKGGALLVYQGGLVDTSTGEELPDKNAGSPPCLPVRQDRSLGPTRKRSLIIDWSNYRDYCHQALE